MKKYKIGANLIQFIKRLYDKATSAVLFNSSMADWFQTTVGIRQGCLLSQDHDATVSIYGRTITNFSLADDIDGLAGEEEELAKLVECLDIASTAYEMEISVEKTKLMTNNTSVINTEVKVKQTKA